MARPPRRCRRDRLEVMPPGTEYLVRSWPAGNGLPLARPTRPPESHPMPQVASIWERLADSLPSSSRSDSHATESEDPPPVLPAGPDPDDPEPQEPFPPRPRNLRGSHQPLQRGRVDLAQRQHA